MALFTRLQPITPVVALCLSVPLHAQSPIALQPLVPVSPGQAVPPAVEPPRLPKSDQQITLDKIPKASENAPPKVESEREIRDKIATQSMSELKLKNATSVGGVKSVDQMIRQPIDFFQNFTRVLAQEDNAPLQQSPSIRGQMFDPSATYDWTPTGYCWQSPAFCYSPLYFEQPNLERYGTGPGHYVAPIASAGYFYAQVAVWPISFWRNPCWCKECTLGHHRPGDCTPHQYRYVERRANGPRQLLAQNTVHPTVQLPGSEVQHSVTSTEEKREAIPQIPVPPNAPAQPLSQPQLASAQLTQSGFSNPRVLSGPPQLAVAQSVESWLPPPVHITTPNDTQSGKPPNPEVRKISAP